MPKHYTSVDGLFGQKTHYDDNGNYAIWQSEGMKTADDAENN